MHHQIREALSHLTSGEPQQYRNVTLVPLLAAHLVEPGYLTLDEALARKVARITEISEGGSVPELRFVNDADVPVLLVDGEELVGAKQNRVLNLTILVGPRQKVVIPVSCVEQGRWGYSSRQFSSAKRTLFASARAKNMAHVTEDLQRTGWRRSNQREVWQDIGVKFTQMRVASQSMAMSDLYEARDGDLAGYRHSFKAVAGQVGAVVGINGRIAGLELFDAQRTYAQLLEKIVSSYAMDALEEEGTQSPSPSGQAVRAFLEQLQKAPSREHPAIAQGTDVRLSTPHLAGAALVEGGRVLHLAAFRVAEEVAE